MSKPNCSIEGCEKPIWSRGWCGAHYQRWRITGDPTTPKQAKTYAGPPAFSTAPANERAMWPSQLATCVDWTGPLDKAGYGRLGSLKIHREVFIAISGIVPEVVRHTCDNPKCYRIEHLLPGTHADNVADRVTRGRGATGKRNRGGRRLTL